MRKEDIFLFTTTQLELEHIMLSEISQANVDKYCMISVICGIQKCEPIKKQRNREKNGGYQGGGDNIHGV